MLAIFFTLIQCNIDTLGNYSVYATYYGAQMEINLETIPEYDYFIVLSNPRSDLYINGEPYSTHLIKIVSNSILFKCQNSFLLNFVVFLLPSSCQAREFINNPREGDIYTYDSSKNLETNVQYCLAIASDNLIDVDIVKSTSNNNIISYSQYDLHNSSEISAGETKSISSTYGICLYYKSSSSTPSTLSVKIKKVEQNVESLSTTIVYDSSGKNYLASDGISVMDFSESIALGLNTIIVNQKPNVYCVPKSSYIVFTEFQNIKGNVMTSRGKKFEILGTTNIVAIYFNSTGNISLYTKESTPQTCKLVHYRDFSPNCTKIITISGPRTYVMDGKYGENSCLVTAFSLGYIQTTEFGAMNSSYYGADGIDQYTFFKIYFFSAQYTNFTPLYPNENVSLKYEIKTSHEDHSLKYTIEDDSNYKAYYLSEKSFKKLRTGEDKIKIKISALIWLSCMIVVVILCIVGVVALYVCLRKRRPAHSRHDDKEEQTQSTTNGGSSQEKYSEPLVDNAVQP